MTASVKIMKAEIATGYPAYSYIVELEGGGRGIFAAASAVEAEELATRINNYPALTMELLKAQTEVERLKKQLRKLRQAQRNGGAA